jgi:hypothetical protein
MPKCEITVGKKFTLNTQNFSSVSPSVTIKITDLTDIKDILKAHEIVELIADGLLHKQMESDAKTMALIKKLGFAKYFKQVRENGDMDTVLEEAVRKLSLGTDDIPF